MSKTVTIPKEIPGHEDVSVWINFDHVIVKRGVETEISDEMYEVLAASGIDFETSE